MANIWYAQPATFKVDGDTITAVGRAVSSQRKRGNGLAYKLDTPDYWRGWLEAFTELQDTKDLLWYLKRDGFPHLQIKPSQTTEEKVSKLLGAAAYLQWLLWLLDATKRNHRSELKSLCQPRSVTNPDKQGRVTVTLVPSESLGLKNWRGFQKLGYAPKTVLDLQITCSQDRYRKGSWQVSLKDARLYLTEAINLLVEGISPRIQGNFQSVLIPRSPYEAMCLSLLAQATGDPVSKKCKRDGCPKFITTGVADGNNRKQRADKQFCSSKCRQYAYDSAKRARKLAPGAEIQ